MALRSRGLVVRSLLIVVVPVVLAVVLLAVQEGWRRRPEAGPSAAPVLGQAEKLERKSRAVLRQLNQKLRVARAVRAGRLTLLEGAALFRALDEGSPWFNPERFRLIYPGDSDEERHCRMVIRFAYSYFPEDAPPSEEARLRLRELSEHLRRGPLRLPDVEPLRAFLDAVPD
jgi:hypothetical protein